MKKIPKSITVTVRNGDNFRATRPGVRYSSGGYDYRRVLETFPHTPKPPYRLTYSVNPRGPFLVHDNGCAYPEIQKVKCDNARIQTILCCFMRGLGWHGLRVSRHVEKVKE